MKIVVCAKQVPNTNEVKIDPIKGTLMRDGVESILNPDDANALEAALQIKDNDPKTFITVISMGPPQAEDMLRECLAMGADEAILVSDRAFGGADSWATSNTLSAAIAKIGDYDLILAGRQAIDGDTAQVGPQIAEKLNLPQVTYVSEVNITTDFIEAKRQMEDGYEILRMKTPALLTAVKEWNTPRYMTVDGIYKAYEKEIKTWSLKDLEISPSLVGLKASPTKVYKSFTPEPKGVGVMFEGTPRDQVAELVLALTESHIV